MDVSPFSFLELRFDAILTPNWTCVGFVLVVKVLISVAIAFSLYRFEYQRRRFKSCHPPPGWCNMPCGASCRDADTDHEIPKPFARLPLGGIATQNRPQRL